MKVILSLTPDFLPSPNNWHPPHSLLQLGACLKEEDCEIRILDPVLKQMSLRDILTEVIYYSPDIFGISVTTETYFKAVKLIKNIKRKCPNTITIMGGPHATLLGADILSHLPELDVLVRGEADQAMPAIVRNLKNNRSIEGLPNVISRIKGGALSSGNMNLIQDIDCLPFPDYSLINFDDYNIRYPVKNKGLVKGIGVTSARGCPFDCIFCANSNLFHRKTRYRSISTVVDEIKMRQETLNVDFIYIYDDTFNIKTDRIYQFCDQLERENLNIYWTCLLRIDKVDKAILSRMRSVGFTGCICMAVETINDDLRKNVIGKRVSREQIDLAINAFDDLGLWCNLNFILSLPGETKGDLEENIQFIEQLDMKNPRSAVGLNVLRVYPGTRLEREALERGVLSEGFSWVDRKSIIKNSPGILAGFYGIVPVYREKLRWKDIFVGLFRWKYSKNYSPENREERKISLATYLKAYLSNIQSAQDIIILIYVVIAWLKVLYRNFMKNNNTKKDDKIKKAKSQVII